MIIKLYLPGKMRLSLGKKSNVANAAANEILYIGGSEVLPPPIEGEEENRRGEMKREREREREHTEARRGCSPGVRVM